MIAAPAEALHTCNVSVGNLSFGTFTGARTTSSSTLTVTCTITIGVSEMVNFTATLSTGAGTYAQRLLTHVGAPPDILPYNLYLNSVPAVLNTSVWGDGSAGTVTATGSVNLVLLVQPTQSVSFTVAGAMPAVASMPSAGSYGDIVMAIVTYN